MQNIEEEMQSKQCTNHPHPRTAHSSHYEQGTLEAVSQGPLLSQQDDTHHPICGPGSELGKGDDIQVSPISNL